MHDISKSPATQFQDTIKKLPGVLSASVIVSDLKAEDTDSFHVKEIHVLTNMNRHPKQVSRDIQSIYAASWGRPLDRKVISIAQLEVDDPTEVQGRVQIREVKYQIGYDGAADVQVSLNYCGMSYEGCASGMHTTRNANRLVVEATLICVHSIFSSQHKIVLEDIKEINLAGKKVYNVALCALNNISEEIHVGSAIVRGDEKKALVSATLDALNRRLTMLVK